MTVAILLLCFASVVGVIIYQDYSAWHDGACHQCGCAWVHFDTDSQGGRGYKCSNGCYEPIWISFPVDR